MSTPRFDLVDITQTLRNNRRFIIIVTIAIALLGALASLIRKKKFEAQADFIMSNPLYTDRNNLFRANEMRFVDYFGGDDDIDRIMIVAESDTVRNLIAKRLNLAEAYKLDLSKPEDAAKLKGIFKKNYKINRTEYKTCEVFYTDRDADRAAAVANESIKAMEEVFRGYYINMRERVHLSIQDKMTEMDSTILALTDTLGAMRGAYNIYDIVSPGRQNLIVGSMKGSGGTEYGKAVEKVQNIESIKDQLVVDRAKYVSLLNEFSTGNKTDDMRFIQVITAARPPVDPKGPGLLITVIACTLLGFFFASIYVLIRVYYRMLIAVER